MYKLDITEMHQYYVENISNGNYPISLELSNYLYNLCWEIKPNIILDRGTGFSSFVFRKYILASRRDVKVYSVDNEEVWLNKTKNFLRYCGVTPEHFYIWSRFKELDLDKLKFDLILEDYNFPKRTRSLSEMIGMLDKDGYLIIDDANIKKYRSAVAKTKRRFNITTCLVEETRDQSGRYAELIRWKG